MSAKQTSALTTIVGPFQRFFNIGAASGILLIISTAIAMIMANSGAPNAYTRMVNWELSVRVGNVFKLSKPLILWITGGRDPWLLDIEIHPER